MHFTALTLSSPQRGTCRSLGFWALVTAISNMGITWKDWCWSWNSNTLATWCEELSHLKRSWCWERLKVGGEGNDRGWDGWMASPTQWVWIWAGSGSWWWTGKPGMLQSMGSQRVGHDWAIELNWSLSRFPDDMDTHLLHRGVWHFFKGEKE